MWYFSCILGMGTALGFGIINVMWFDSQRQKSADETDEG